MKRWPLNKLTPYSYLKNLQLVSPDCLDASIESTDLYHYWTCHRSKTNLLVHVREISEVPVGIFELISQLRDLFLRFVPFHLPFDGLFLQELASLLVFFVRHIDLYERRQYYKITKQHRIGRWRRQWKLRREQKNRTNRFFL